MGASRSCPGNLPVWSPGCPSSGFSEAQVDIQAVLMLWDLVVRGSIQHQVHFTCPSVTSAKQKWRGQHLMTVHSSSQCPGP